MSKAIEELWYGNISPFDDAELNNAQAKELLNFISRHREEICASLTRSQKEVFEKYEDCLNEFVCMNKKEAFIYGFRLGAKIATEVLWEGN